jgi:hypothetical protein
MTNIPGIILGLGFILVLSSGQAKGEFHLAADRLPGGKLWERRDVGVEGGIPDSSTRRVYRMLASDSTAAQVNSAIASCPNGQVLALGSGTFSLSSPIQMKSGVLLRGKGPALTILKFAGGGGYNGGLIAFAGPFQDPPSVVSSWIGGLAQGSKTLTLSSVAKLSVGDLVCIDQLNDTRLGVVNLEGFTSRASGARGQSQYARIVGISSPKVTISHPVLMANYSSTLAPQLWKVGRPIESAGVEDLSIVNVRQDIADYNIFFQGAWNCWVKNVGSIGAEKSHVRTYQCGRIEVRHSTFHKTKSYASESYGMNITYSSECLVEDNIFEEVTSPLNLWGGSSGNVVAYNFTKNMRYDQSPAWLSENMFTHGCHPTMNLFEGNYITNIYWDFIHGSASHNTAFRNRVTGWEPGKTGNTFPVVLERNNRYETIVGNVLGTDGIHSRYKLAGTAQSGAPNYVYVFGYAGTDTTSLVNYDAAVASTVLVKENYNYADRATNMAESLQGDALPASWYLTSKPSWFGDRPWPWVDPNAPARAVPTNLPAGYRFVYGVDPAGHL